MKTHLYRIERRDGTDDIEELLFQLEQKTLQQRNRTLEGYTNRIEQVQFEEHDRTRCVLVNYVKLRMDHGPGRAGRNRPTQGFNLAQDEGFAEETAAPFDLEHDHVIVEYNHHGARASSLCDYLGAIGPEGRNLFEFMPCLDQQVYERVYRLQKLTRVEIKVAPHRLTPLDKQEMRSLSAALDFGETADAPMVEITLSGIRGRRPGLGDVVKDTVRKLIEVIGRDETIEQERQRAVAALKVTGKEHERLAAQMLDLVKGRVYGEHELVAGGDRRFSLEDRWNALRRDHLTWRNPIRGR